MRPLPGSRMDTAIFKRETSTADSDGNYQGTIVVLWTGRGTWQELKGRYGASTLPDSAGRPYKAKRNAYFDARVGTAGIQEGDMCVVRGSTWEVTAVEPVRDNTRFVLSAPKPEPFV